MAYKNKLLQNSVTGQDILFLETASDTNGQFLEMQTTYHSRSAEPPLHYHPFQSEDFEVLSGEIRVTLNGATKTLRKSERLHIRANEIHAMWNPSNEKAVVHWKVQPALHTEYLFETINGLLREGKTDASGRPGILQLSLTASKFSREFRLSKPAYFIQLVVFTILKPFAWLAGYRAMYKKYLD